MYGVPSYKEINPALFTTVTFPWLFGMMFGDMGHGFLIFLGACMLCLGGFKCVGDRMPEIVMTQAYPARYLLLLMGCMSMFCGLIYNDFMAIPLNLFGSCFDTKTGKPINASDKNCVYPIGVDPIWFQTT